VRFTAVGREWGAFTAIIFTIHGTFFRGFDTATTVSQKILLSHILTKNLNKFILYFLVSKKKNLSQ
jgi:hypothetical protein